MLNLSEIYYNYMQSFSKGQLHESEIQLIKLEGIVAKIYDKNLPKISENINLILEELASLNPDHLDNQPILQEINRGKNESVRDYLLRLIDLNRRLNEKSRTIALLKYNLEIFTAKMLLTWEQFRNKKSEIPLQQLCNGMIDKLVNLHLQLNKQIKSIPLVRNSILENEIPAQPNTITLRLWQRPAQKNDTIFGMRSDGHISLDICNKDGQRKYISFYVNQNEPPIESAPHIINSIASNLHLPKPDTKTGHFGSTTDDISRLHLSNDQRRYTDCSKVVIECTDDHRLDIHAAYQWADQLLQDKTEHYHFYKNNCSSLVLKGLRIAGSEKFLKFEDAIHGVKSPKSVFNYANNLANHIQQLNFKEKLGKSNIYENDAARITDMLSVANKLIDGIILNLSKNSENYTQLPDMLKNIQKEFNSCLAEINNKSLNVVMSALDDQLNKWIADFQSDLFKDADVRDLIEMLINLKNSSSVLRINKFMMSICENLNAQLPANQKLHFNNLTNIDNVNAVLMQNKLLLDDSVEKFNKQDQNKIHEARGEVNQYLYFNRLATSTSNDKINLLAKLKLFFPSLQNDCVDLAMLVKSGKDQFSNQATSAANKPSIFNPFKWRARHQWFENQTRDSIQITLQDNDKFQTNKDKIIAIRSLVASRKPAWWKFWRSKECDRYRQMEQKAKLICIVDDFCRGKIDLPRLASAIDAIKHSYPVNLQAHITDFVDSCKFCYEQYSREYDTNLDNDINSKTSMRIRLKNKLSTYAQLLEAKFSHDVPAYPQYVIKAYDIAKTATPDTGNTLTALTSLHFDLEKARYPLRRCW